MNRLMRWLLRPKKNSKKSPKITKPLKGALFMIGNTI